MMVTLCEGSPIPQSGGRSVGTGNRLAKQLASLVFLPDIIAFNIIQRALGTGREFVV